MRWHIWALAALAGVAAEAGSAGAQTDPKTVVATANGRTVTLGEVDAVIKLRPQPANTSEAELKQLRYEAACLLVDGILWDQYLHKNGPRIDKAEVTKRMAELEEAVKKAGHTMPDYYRESGQTEAAVCAGIASVLQWDAIARSKLSEAQLKHYYDRNRDYFDKVTVHARHIVLRVPASAPEAERQAARDKLLAIRANLIAGTIDFAEAARRYSQDTTAAAGGDLGTFPRRFVMPESIAKVAFALPVNGISDVVQSEYGLHLITVVERKGPAAGRVPDFETIEDEVRDRCADELRLAVMQQLRQAAKIHFNLPN